MPNPPSTSKSESEWETLRAALPWRAYGMEPPGDTSLNEALAAFDSLRSTLSQVEAERDELLPARESVDQLQDELVLLSDRLSQVERERDELVEGFKRNLRLGTEQVRAQRDEVIAALREHHDHVLTVNGRRLHPSELLTCPICLAHLTKEEQPDTLS